MHSSIALTEWTLKRTSSNTGGKESCNYIMEIGDQCGVTIAHLFRVGVSTVCVIIQNTCKAIVDVLLKKYTKISE